MSYTCCQGYIHAIEQRWHQVESLLGAIIQATDPKVQSLVRELKQDDLAREIITRVDNGPYVWSLPRLRSQAYDLQQGPSGRASGPEASTKEDFFASVLRSNESTAQAEPSGSRSRRQSRVSREKVSSSQGLYSYPHNCIKGYTMLIDRGLSILPTREWQENLSKSLGSRGSHELLDPSSSGSSHPSPIDRTPPVSQRRRLHAPRKDPDWDSMYTMDSSGNIFPLSVSWHVLIFEQMIPSETQQKEWGSYLWMRTRRLAK